ncbi:GNAT family acetyltransferase [Oleiphilus sp. HI0009]|uniref:GNAT family N-acetyltransferase n=2 Tax=Oleiphilus TaxID=141450 RepID=UPI0007C38591|nr:MULTISPECIES: GNAT family N-acetyltransferase [unclassified Oleiphilus]KZX77506.1 GNAT family acetyltransferase [Oleiphilus sp. HI0009]MCH2159088.1 GNAT family N-acetyltransferase [Oleiphilaceae bacterium]KZY65531.1 GNAT family acetyltransferase [Oleiphilus sp. HI0066]KZY69050.1 GNAT family acetyltransferase [Oleiphilus sp. HI0067]KZZ61295.1 GNAT family acetyltransferase [Oleiphilus sp. HI0125]
MPITTDEVEARVVRLDASAIKEARTILFRAYKHEPTFKYLFQAERPGYDQRVRATIRELCHLHFSLDQEVIGLTLDSRLIAVALVGSPVVRLDLSRQFAWRMRMLLTAGSESTWRYIEYHKQIHKVLPHGEHHELPLIGVDAQHRSLGYGKQLMAAVEEVCRENPASSGIALDTGNMRYISFYEKLGYRIVGSVAVGDVTESVLFKSF